MMGHLEKPELRSFLQGKMPPEALLETDDHLAACSRCREALEIEAQMGLSLTDIDALLQPPAEHIEYVQLQQMVDNQSVPSSVANHVADCAMCSRELAELRQFAQQIASMPRSGAKIVAIDAKRNWHMPAGWFALAAVLVLAVAAGLSWHNLTHLQHGSTALASLRDGKGQLTVDNAGKLLGAEDLPESDRAALRSAMTTGRIESVLPSRFAGQKQETMLGAPSAAPAFKVLSPVDRVLVNDLVDFKWEPVEGAVSYRVTIFDSEYKKIVESPSIQQTDWKSTKALPRGVVYTWAVIAQKRDGTVRAPAPPQPEAAFKVVSQDEAAKISEAVENHPSDHLMLAVLYARAGAIEEARSQLDQLSGDNPNSPLVAQLKASLTHAPQAASPMKTNPAQ